MVSAKTPVWKKLISNMQGNWRQYNWSKWEPKNMDRKKLGWAIRSMFRPIATFSDIKYEKKGSLMIANLICLGMLVVSCIEYSCKGFVFNYNTPENFNIYVTLLSSSLLMLLWAVSNWGICSLLDGEGTFYEIWIMTCYSMLPRVVFSIPLILFSNIITLEEQGLYSMLSTILLLWCCILLMLGMMTAHQYTAKKTIVSALLSIAGIAILLFLAVLFYSMLQQFIAFFQTVFTEIRYRL